MILSSCHCSLPRKLRRLMYESLFQCILNTQVSIEHRKVELAFECLIEGGKCVGQAARIFTRKSCERTVDDVWSKKLMGYKHMQFSFMQTVDNET
jgi:hypothetical protein